LAHKKTTFITEEIIFPPGSPWLCNLDSMGSSSNFLFAKAADNTSFVATSNATCGLYTSGQQLTNPGMWKKSRKKSPQWMVKSSCVLV
jgi:hypothetical protein